MANLRFSADNSEVRFDLPSAVDFTGAYTLACVIRRRATSGFQAIFSHHNSTGSAVLWFEFNGTSLQHYVSQANVSSSTWSVSPTTFNETTNWWLLAVSRPAGTTQTIRFHRKNLTSGAAFEHVNGSVAASNPASCAGGTIRVGEYEDGDDANMNCAVIGGWAADLGDSGVEALATNLRTSDWTGHATAPKYVHELTSTSSIPDLMGNGATLNVVNGTTLDTGTDPPGWTYDGAGSGSQNISPGHLASGAQLFAPSFAPGAVTIQPGHLASTAQLFAPALAQVVAPGHVASGAQLFTPGLAPGSVTVQPGHLASGAQLFAPSVGGSTAVQPDLLASGAQLFAPTLAVGSVNVTPGFLASGAQVFTPTLTGGEVTARAKSMMMMGVE